MNPQGHQTSEAGHERKDADVLGLAMIALFVLLIVGTSLLVVFGVMHLLNRDRAVEETARPRAMTAVNQFPGARLLIQPGGELGKTQSAAKTILDGYGWVDRPAGIARIPVAQAMQILAERGLPEAGAGQTRLRLMQARPGTGVQPNEPATSPTPEPKP